MQSPGTVGWVDARLGRLGPDVYGAPGRSEPRPQAGRHPRAGRDLSRAAQHQHCVDGRVHGREDRRPEPLGHAGHGLGSGHERRRHPGHRGPLEQRRDGVLRERQPRVHPWPELPAEDRFGSDLPSPERLRVLLRRCQQGRADRPASVEVRFLVPADEPGGLLPGDAGAGHPRGGRHQGRALCRRPERKRGHAARLSRERSNDGGRARLGGGAGWPRDRTARHGRRRPRHGPDVRLRARDALARREASASGPIAADGNHVRLRRDRLRLHLHGAQAAYGGQVPHRLRPRGPERSQRNRECGSAERGPLRGRAPRHRHPRRESTGSRRIHQQDLRRGAHGGAAVQAAQAGDEGVPRRERRDGERDHRLPRVRARRVPVDDPDGDGAGQPDGNEDLCTTPRIHERARMPGHRRGRAGNALGPRARFHPRSGDYAEWRRAGDESGKCRAGWPLDAPGRRVRRGVLGHLGGCAGAGDVDVPVRARDAAAPAGRCTHRGGHPGDE